ncbi:MAG: hypothetical protein ACE5FU_11870 [Nitrospinota bacterium]
MPAENEELKKALMDAYEKKVDKLLKVKSGKTLWEMEDLVEELKNETGQEMMEAKVKLKKT